MTSWTLASSCSTSRQPQPPSRARVGAQLHAPAWKRSHPLCVLTVTPAVLPTSPSGAPCFNLLVAADVLVYIGDLLPLLRAAAGTASDGCGGVGGFGGGGKGAWAAA